MVDWNSHPDAPDTSGGYLKHTGESTKAAWAAASELRSLNAKFAIFLLINHDLTEILELRERYSEDDPDAN